VARRGLVGDPPVRVFEAAETKEYRRSGAATRIGRGAALLPRGLDALLNHGGVVAGRGSLHAYGGDLQQRSSPSSTLPRGRPRTRWPLPTLTLPALESAGSGSSPGRARDQGTAEVHDSDIAEATGARSSGRPVDRVATPAAPHARRLLDADGDARRERQCQELYADSKLLATRKASALGGRGVRRLGPAEGGEPASEPHRDESASGTD
jgi:hypothetical protein